MIKIEIMEVNRVYSLWMRLTSIKDEMNRKKWEIKEKVYEMNKGKHIGKKS